MENRRESGRWPNEGDRFVDLLCQPDTTDIGNQINPLIVAE